MVHEHRRGVHVIHGDVEEALDLIGVEIHRQHPVHPRRGDHVGHHLGADGYPHGPGPPILTGVTEVGHHRRDPPRGRALKRIRHDQQLKNGVTRGRTGGLEDEHVLASDVLLDFHVHFAVTKTSHAGAAQAIAEAIRDALG